jgi:alpha-L-fucosidase
LTNYHPAVLWFDTPLPMRQERTNEFLAVLKLRPGLVYNNRLGNGVPGDTETPEQNIPAYGYPGRDWETCMTINDTWGYKSYDTNFKSTQVLLRNLIDIASKGGNYLLNVGPTAKGVIPQPEVDRLQEVGKWLQANGESIYGTSAGPFKKQLAWGRCTRKGGKLYLHVFDWPNDGHLNVPISNHVSKAYLLARPDHVLHVQCGPDGARVNLPAAATDKIATVVVLEIDGAAAPIAQLPVQASNGSITLGAMDAEIVGATARIEGENIGFWTDPSDYLRWKIKVTQPGSFKAELNYALQPGSGGSEFVLAAGEQKLTAKLAATGGWTDYTSIRLGSLAIGAAGDVTITLKPTKKPGVGVMNFRWLKLKPAAK